MKIKTIPWSQFVKVEGRTYTTLRIIPDSGARNWRSEDIMKTIADQFRLPIDRISRAGRLQFQYRAQERAAFEICFENGRVRFYLSVPEQIAPLIKRRILSVWGGATVEEADQPGALDPSRTAIYEAVYQRHDLYSIHTDAKDNLPLESLMEGGRLLGEGERARIFSYFEPIHQLSYQSDMAEAWRRLREGRVPQKFSLNFRTILRGGAIGIASMLREITEGISGMFSSADPKENIYAKKAIDPLASTMALDQLTHSTKQKMSRPATKNFLWIAAESEDASRADLIARSLAASFSDLSADNELISRPLRSKRKEAALETMATRMPPKINITYNLMSTAESAKLLQLPGRELQEKYPEIDHTAHHEVEIDRRLTAGGLYMGEATFKGARSPIFMPTSDWDELCAPRIVVAGMGQGKTRGYGANLLCEAAEANFGALAIDPAKGEIGDEVEAYLPPDKVIRINLADVAYSLDWCELRHSARSSSRMANTIISFFNSTMGDETGGQTARFIRAAVMGMQTGKLAELMRIFEDDKYRAEIIAGMREGMHKATLQQYSNENEGRRRQILSPIYNRLDVILGDEFLEECLQSDRSLDLVELMSQKKAIILDVPKTKLGPEGVEIIVNLIMTKIDLAMTIRPDFMQTDNPHPFFVVIDEPHQFTRSHHIWESATVESRKWRVGYAFLFHEWLQMGRDLRAIIKSALPHYHFYPTSKEIWNSVKEEIYPHTTEAALKLKRFHAINVIRSGGEYLTPFIAKMAAPPSERVRREVKQA